MTSFSWAPIILATSLPAFAFAHGSINDPMPTFSDIYNKNAPSAFKNGTPGPYTGTGSIKALADVAGSTCGNTDANAAALPAPSNEHVAFDISAVHIGPCELWLDDTLMENAADFWTPYADKKLPLDYSQCTGSQCQIRWAGGTTDESTTKLPHPSPTNSNSTSTDTIPGKVAPASSSGTCSYRGNGNEKYDTWCEVNCAAGYCPESLCEAC